MTTNTLLDSHRLVQVLDGLAELNTRFRRLAYFFGALCATMALALILVVMRNNQVASSLEELQDQQQRTLNDYKRVQYLATTHEKESLQKNKHLLGLSRRIAELEGKAPLPD